MKAQPYAALLALAILASPAPAATVVIARGKPIGTTTLADELRSKFDPQLESLRAGRIDNLPPLTEDERAILRAAQAKSTDLADMRAGGVSSLLLLVVVVVLILVLV